MTLTFRLLLLSLSILGAECFNAKVPTQTIYGDDRADILGWTPKPTGLPQMRELIKRNVVPSGTCGYVTNDQYNSLTCNNDEYCGVRTDLNVIGCCSTYYQTNGVYSMTGCSFHTTCIASAALSSCDSDCFANPLNLLCTDSVYPYCMSYTYTDVGYTILDCDKYPGIVTYLGETYAGEFTSSTGSLLAGAPATEASGVSASASSIASSGVALTNSEFGPASASSPASARTHQQSVTTSSSTSTSTSTSLKNVTGTGTGSKSKSDIAAIAGGIVGGLLVVALATGATTWFCFRRLKRKSENNPPGQAGTAMEIYQDSSSVPYVVSDFSNKTPSSPTITSPTLSTLSHPGFTQSPQSQYPPMPSDNKPYTYEMHQNDPPLPHQGTYSSYTSMNEMAAPPYVPPEMDGRNQPQQRYGGPGRTGPPPSELPG